jgi:hypothetical protein
MVFREMKGPGIESVRAALRHLAGVCVAALVLFHAWLMGRRLSDPTALDPRVLLRWLAALAVVGALLWLRRLGLPLLRGRKALALWTVALLLHGNAGTGALATVTQTTSGPETLVLVIPGVLSVATASALLLFASVRPRPLLAPARCSGLTPPFASRRLLASGRAGRGCRAPPAFS